METNQFKTAAPPANGEGSDAKETSEGDYLLRARAAHDELLVLALTSKNLVDAKRKKGNYSPIACAALGRLMSGALLMADTLKSDEADLSLQISGEGPISSLLAIANSKGEVKGYASNTDVILPPNASGHLNVGGALTPGQLTVIEDYHLKKPHMSTIDLYSGEIAEDLAYYYAQSMQTPTIAALGVHFDKETVAVDASGGIIVQLLPNASEETISQLEKNLSSFPDVSSILLADPRPEALIERLLAGFDVKYEKRKSVCFRCDCSKSRSKKILRSLPISELESLLKEQGAARMRCSYCEKEYVFTAEEIEEIIKEKKA